MGAGVGAQGKARKAWLAESTEVHTEASEPSRAAQEPLKQCLPETIRDACWSTGSGAGYQTTSLGMDQNLPTKNLR